jgi:hypothetical protein
MNISKTAANNYEVAVTKNGKKLAEQSINIASYGGGEKAVTTDKKGKATVTLEKPGVHVLSVEWIDKTPGEFKGKKYETVRHILDYSLYN